MYNIVVGAFIHRGVLSRIQAQAALHEHEDCKCAGGRNGLAALLAAQETAMAALEGLLGELPLQLVQQLFACAPLAEGRSTLARSPLVSLLVQPRLYALRQSSVRMRLAALLLEVSLFCCTAATTCCRQVWTDCGSCLPGVKSIRKRAWRWLHVFAARPCAAAEIWAASIDACGGCLKPTRHQSDLVQGLLATAVSSVWHAVHALPCTALPTVHNANPSISSQLTRQSEP